MGGTRWHDVSDIDDVLRTFAEVSQPTVWISGEILRIRSTNNDTAQRLTVIMAQRGGNFVEIPVYIPPKWWTKIDRFLRERDKLDQFVVGRQVTFEGRMRLTPPSTELEFYVYRVDPDLPTGSWTNWREEQCRIFRAAHPSRPNVSRLDHFVIDATLGDRDIVVLGSESIDGVKDFLDKLRRAECRGMPKRYSERVRFTGTRLQGEHEKVVNGLVKALAMVDAQSTGLVVITRGGGKAADRTPFDDARVACAVAECSVPVVVGIGHKSNTHLISEAAGVSYPTPSEAGARVGRASWSGRNLQELHSAALAMDREQSRVSRTVIPTTPIVRSVPARPVAATPRQFVPAVPAAPSLPVRRPQVQPTPPFPHVAVPNYLAPVPAKKRWRGVPRVGRRKLAALTVVAVLAALTPFAYATVSDYVEDLGRPTGELIQTAPQQFADTSRNIVCSGSADGVRCDINVVYYDMASVPQPCRSTPNWGHVFVVDSKGVRLACPPKRAVANATSKAPSLPRQQMRAVGRGVCTADHGSMRCVVGSHGFELHPGWYRTW